jgi:hypothetical protein
MENLNAEQIKKSVEVCFFGHNCEGCQYGYMKCCLEKLGAATLSLIKSQEQRIGAQDMTISELRQRAEKAEHDADRYAQKIKELTEENERRKYHIQGCAN